MRVFQIPVSARPQIFTVGLNNVEYTWRVYWLVPANCWVVDIMDQSRQPLIRGIPLVTGADLLAQYGYVGIGGQLFTLSDQLPPDTVPDFTHLGITGKVYYVLPDEVS